MDAAEIQRVLVDHLCKTRELPQGTFDISLNLFVDGADSYAELIVDTPEDATFERCNTVQINRLEMVNTDAPRTAG
jgi:hypothetical protein